MIDRLVSEVRAYAWGHRSSIPDLLGVEPSGEPQAEMWIGSHPLAPSRLVGADSFLDAAIAADPEAMVGPRLAAPGVGLPFLCKFLAAGEPLSIQVHPTLEQARVGFARENELGIALDSPLRTYRDDNHKPEMVVALEPFSALCGFRSLPATIEIVEGLGFASLEPLLEQLRGNGAASGVLCSTVQWALGLEPDDLAKMLDPVLASTSMADHPELGWVPGVAQHYPNDAGLLVGLLLNHIVLQPGEAVFLPAGNVHAYICGFAVEVMATSDNVIRCGWTSKNIDVNELVSVASFESIDPPVQRPSAAVHRYEAAVPEFSLRRIDAWASEQAVEVPRNDPAPEVVFVTEGSLTLESSTGHELLLAPGEAVFISADEGPYRLRGDGMVWSATVNDRL